MKFASAFSPLNRCLSHQSTLVSSIVNYGVHYGRMFSPVGRNFIFCQRRYNFRSSELVSGSVDSRVVRRHFCLSISEQNLYCAEFIRELVSLRDCASVLVPHASFLSRDNIIEIINYVANL